MKILTALIESLLIIILVALFTLPFFVLNGLTAQAPSTVVFRTGK